MEVTEVEISEITVHKEGTNEALAMLQSLFSRPQAATQLLSSITSGTGLPTFLTTGGNSAAGTSSNSAGGWWVGGGG